MLQIAADEGTIREARLRAELAALRAAYRRAQPLQHLVIDEFLAPEAAAAVLAHFPPVERRDALLAKMLEARLQDARIGRCDSSIAGLFSALCAPSFVGWLRELTGIDDLEADDALVGAGLHQGSDGSFLQIHADHNTHPHDASRYRRINVLIYFNPVWDSERWSGDLELWDAAMTACRRRIAPLFNRAMIMDVHDTGFHGYDKLRLPPGVTRKLAACYYYSASPGPLQSAQPHPTLLQVRPEAPPLERAKQSLRKLTPQRALLRDLVGGRLEQRRPPGRTGV